MSKNINALQYVILRDNILILWAIADIFDL